MTLALLPEVEAAIDEAAATIDALDEDDWRRPCDPRLERTRDRPGNPTKEAVRRDLRKGRSRLHVLLSEMSETQLRRVALTYQGHEFDVERIVRRIVLPHTRGHLASIRAAIAASR